MSLFFDHIWGITLGFALGMAFIIFAGVFVAIKEKL